MDDETTFRLVLIAGFAVFLVIGLYHRLKSHRTREPLDRRQEGTFILATLRPAGIAIWLGILAYMLNPAWMAWSAVPLPGWARWTGAAVYVAAATLITWTLRSLGPNLTDTVVTRRAHTLIAAGPYRWVRHPFYDSAALMIAAVSLLAANWFFLLAGSVVLSLLVIRTRTEEANLIARFGDAYRTYMAQTGRFIPRRPRRIARIDSSA